LNVHDSQPMSNKSCSCEELKKFDLNRSLMLVNGYDLMFRKFILFNLVLTFSVIVLGAYVRLSDAGLGCPDWPGCYGKLIVPETSEDIAHANQAFPDRPLETQKAWKEMAHRYLAGGLGVMILLLAISSCFRKQNKAVAVKLSFLLLLLVVFQALLGMWTVLFNVMPLTVVAHLITGLLTLYLLFCLYLRTAPNIEVVSDRTSLKWLSRISFFVLLVQIFLGGWTSSNYAGLACPDFPTCQAEWWPDVDYFDAFLVSTDIGVDYEGGILGNSARAAIHFTHRLGAIVTFLVLSLLAIKSVGYPKEKALARGAAILSFLLFLQVGLGIANVVLRMPVAVAAAHNGVAALLLLAIAYIRFYSTSTHCIPEQLGDEVALDGSDVSVMGEEGGISEIEPDVLLEKSPESLFVRLKSQLNRTRSGLADALVSLPIGKKAIDEELFEEIESNLLMADVGVEATAEIMQSLVQSVKRDECNDSAAVIKLLREQLAMILAPCSKPLDISSERPFVILVVGVNGVGKTTMIGKLAKRLQMQGHSVMLAAGDTFRAAATEQLQVWGERNGIHVVAQHSGADSASVIYDGVQSANARGVDVLIADTAGRLHTKSNLMEELTKIKRIASKLDSFAPHEILLVLDAGTGQNALNQTEQFDQSLNLTGLALTKLDGTAKGGIIFALAKRFGIPIRFIGIGEGIDDLQDFDANTFVDALFDAEAVRLH